MHHMGCDATFVDTILKKVRGGAKVLPFLCTKMQKMSDFREFAQK